MLQKAGDVALLVAICGIASSVIVISKDEEVLAGMSTWAQGKGFKQGYEAVAEQNSHIGERFSD